jgi:hypothetical protein
MRLSCGMAGLLVSLAAVRAFGQAPPPAPDAALVPPPRWAFNDIACAPMLAMEIPKGELRVVGSQDTVIRRLLGPGDTLVIGGGSSIGLQPGQQYYVRRMVKTQGAGRSDRHQPVSIHTAGWIQILGVDSTVATASVVHACDGILLDDYLEPFVAPLIAAQQTAGSGAEYDNMGRIMTGDENRRSASIGQMMSINRGTNTGVALGQRFLVFRDKRTLRFDTSHSSPELAAAIVRLPLIQIGEVLVVTARGEDATVQVVVAKDAVLSGDLIAPVR